METTQSVQELKAERVQKESLALMRKRILEQDDPVGAALSASQAQAEGRLKAERVQLRLKRMPGWSLLAEGKAIDRVRQFESPLAAASYLMFASLLARQVGQPLRISQVGNTVVIALTGRAKGPVAARGLTEEVLDFAEQLG
jgi:pterin-4a-carbinolamine dehydratase